ncbi:hypothetical protein NQ317_018153 [Molorchus minor]|uniref:Uncharacterized protein n=1 Tax=Molorchus minor TaxID=1323400 RepID=A0ABQ9J355_9CUCU|nr:hypothetical protein NQ317_018153 [Molorchus minor]
MVRYLKHRAIGNFIHWWLMVVIKSSVDLKYNNFSARFVASGFEDPRGDKVEIDGEGMNGAFDFKSALSPAPLDVVPLVNALLETEIRPDEILIGLKSCGLNAMPRFWIKCWLQPKEKSCLYTFSKKNSNEHSKPTYYRTFFQSIS